MKKFMLIGFLLLIGVSDVFCQTAKENNDVETVKFKGKFYKLEWSDDFDSPKDLDKNWWTLDEDFGESKAQNGYHIWASKENRTIENGILILKSSVDKVKKTCSGATLNSKKLFLLENTMWEIKFKVSASKGGDWFVFLLLPNNKLGHYGYPLYDKVTLNEITPFELQTKAGGYRSACYFYDNEKFNGNNMDTNRSMTLSNSFFKKWHTLRFVWEDKKYYCYMDNQLIYTVNKNDILKSMSADDLYARAYIGADMMGEWCGNIDVDMPEAYYYVDYIKVWRKE